MNWGSPSRAAPGWLRGCPGAVFNVGGERVTEEEKKNIDERLKVTSEIIPSFCLQGIDRTMNQFSNK